MKITVKITEIPCTLLIINWVVFLQLILLPLNLTAQSAGENLFKPDIEHTIQIQLYKPADWDSIKARYQFASEKLTYTPVKITIDNNVIDSVGLAIKGNTYIDPDSSVLNYPFKVDLNEFVKGQKYDGLKKFNLNNEENSNSIVMNNIYAAFQLPYLRTALTKVYLNETLLGTYLIVEQVDKTYAKRIFGNDKGNLFKGDNQADLSWLGPNQPDYEYRYSLKTNEEKNDYSMLIHFIDILNNTNQPALRDSIMSNFDLTGYLNILSLQVLMGKHDDYFDKNHNFYLYHNSANNKLVYIPYDNDMLLLPGHDLFMTNAQHLPLFRALFTDVAITQQYVNCMCNIIANIKPVIPVIETRYNANYSIYKEYIDNSISSLNDEIINAGYSCTTSIPTTNKNITLMYTTGSSIFIKPSGYANDKLQIINLNGQVVYQQIFHGINWNTRTISLTFLPKGIYIAKLKSKHVTEVLKVISSAH